MRQVRRSGDVRVYECGVGIGQLFVLVAQAERERQVRRGLPLISDKTGDISGLELKRGGPKTLRVVGVAGQHAHAGGRVVAVVRRQVVRSKVHHV